MKILCEQYQLLLEKKFPPEFYKVLHLPFAYDYNGLKYFKHQLEQYIDGINFEKTTFTKMTKEDLEEYQPKYDLYGQQPPERNAIILVYSDMYRTSISSYILYYNDAKEYVSDGNFLNAFYDDYSPVVGYFIDAVTDQKTIHKQRSDNRYGAIERDFKFCNRDVLDAMYDTDISEFRRDISGYLYDTAKYKKILYNMYGLKRENPIIKKLVRVREKVAAIITHLDSTYPIEFIKNMQDLHSKISDLLHSISHQLTMRYITYNFSSWFKKNNIEELIDSLIEEYNNLCSQYGYEEKSE